jgi:hypothetical protein
MTDQKERETSLVGISTVFMLCLDGILLMHLKVVSMKGENAIDVRSYLGV